MLEEGNDVRTYLNLNNWKEAKITAINTTELSIKSKVDYEGEIFLNLSNKGYKELSRESLLIVKLRLINSLIPLAIQYKSAKGEDRKFLSRDIDNINANISVICICISMIMEII